MAKKKYKKTVGHFFYNGSSLGNQYSLFPQGTSGWGLGSSGNSTQGSQASLFPQGTNNWKLDTSKAPTAQDTQNLINSSKGNGESGGGGGSFMSKAGKVLGYLETLDSLAQNLTVGIDAQRAGVNNQPQVLVEGVLGGQSGSHLGNMWNTGAKTAEAVNYVNQQGNVDFVGSSNDDLLAQHSGVGTMDRLNIDTRGKEWEDAILDPASYVLTRWVFKNREKASDRQKRINEAIDAVNTRQQQAYNGAVSDFEKRIDRQIAMNYRAFGGPLDDFTAFGGGALGYDVAKDNIIAKQMANQDKMKNSYSYVPTFATGGLLSDNFTNGVTMINAGGRHEGNPNMGVPMGMAPDGQPNLVEEGETIYNDYVFSDRLRVPEAIRKKYKLRGPKDMTYSEAFKKAQEESKERENDPISKNGLDNIAMVLAQSQEEVKAKKESRKKANGGRLFAFGGDDDYDPSSMTPEEFYRITGRWPISLEQPINWTPEGTERVAPQSAVVTPQVGTVAPIKTVTPGGATVTPQGNNTDKTSRESTSRGWGINPLRLAEPFANAAAVWTDTLGITNKPTYFNYIPNYQATAFTPLGNYAPEAHFDINYAANQAAQQAAATRNAIMNTTAPNRYATLLAADYNAQVADGELRRKASMDAYDNLLKTLTFNRATDQYKSEMAPKIALENAKQRLAYANAKLAEARYNEDNSNAAWGARAKNIGNLATSIANIGREQDARQDRDLLIGSMGRGMSLDQIKGWVSPSKQKEYAKALGYTDEEIKAAGIKAYGGKLKKRKGLTY